MYDSEILVKLTA